MCWADIAASSALLGKDGVGHGLQSFSFFRSQSAFQLLQEGVNGFEGCQGLQVAVFEDNVQRGLAVGLGERRRTLEGGICRLIITVSVVDLLFSKFLGFLMKLVNIWQRSWFWYPRLWKH